jgi:ATP-dependent exoDNAse (exonuclease V) beta subunit
MTRAKEHLVCVGTCRATALEEWENLWRRHRGALPADVVLSARGPIFWLGPIWKMTEQTQAPVFDVTTIEPEDWQTWKHPSREKLGFDEEQKAMANLEPLAGGPAANALADEVIARFSKGYAHAAMTLVPAAQSVTTLAKGNRNLVGEDLPLTHPAETIGRHRGGDKIRMPLEGQNTEDRLLRKLDLPDFLEAEAAPKPTDIGNATHRFLELCDFSAGTEAGIAAQIKDLVTRKFLSPAQAALVDRPALVWFFSTELAKQLARKQSDVIREIPFAMGYSSDFAAEAADQTMIRGRIDLLIRQPGGTVSIVDYKTDRLTPDEVRQRMESYQGQMEHYRTAMERIAGAKVAAIRLVFLSARVIAEL